MEFQMKSVWPIFKNFDLRALLAGISLWMIHRERGKEKIETTINFKSLWRKMRFDNIHDGCSRVVRKKAVDCWLVSWVDSTKQCSCIFPFITKTEFDVFFRISFLEATRTITQKHYLVFAWKLPSNTTFSFSSFLELNVRNIPPTPLIFYCQCCT